MKLKEQFGKALQKVFDTGVNLSNKFNAVGVRRTSEGYARLPDWPGAYAYYRADFKTKAFFNASDRAYEAVANPAEAIAKKIGCKLDTSKTTYRQGELWRFSKLNPARPK
jgi:hypothetical protein